MQQDKTTHFIRTMKHLTEKEYSELSHLQEICFKDDGINLKLELEYKLHLGKASNQAYHNSTVDDSIQSNEFLYYIDDILVSYLGISCFGGNIGEINGMTHPDWRRKGLFQSLLSLAFKECQQRNFSQLLLLSDGKSDSGNTFIQKIGGTYEHSEYRMKLCHDDLSDLLNPSSISLRIATEKDSTEIAKQNTIYFNEEEEDPDEDASSDIKILPNVDVYLVELSGETIGKINIEYSSSSAFVFGFGILPAYRGKGYGKATLKDVLQIIQARGIKDVELDVVCTNGNALNLYKACGFEEKSIMNYYALLID